MTERALVLGGGGPVGIAWEVGLVAGLAAVGVDPMRADFVLGTSAGAFIGAQLLTGIDPQMLVQLHLAVSRETAKRGAAQPAPLPTALYEFMRRTPPDAPPTQSSCAEIGQFALQAQTLPEAEFLARFGGMFGPVPVWSARLACTAVNARDGRFKLWRQADQVPLERAVAASCSVPGLFPPVTLQDEPWIDGGVRSWTNADCAAGYRRVIVVAVVSPENRQLQLPVLERERRAIEAAQGQVALVMPDADSVAAFGDELMGGVRGEEITNAGIAQGRREAAALQALWD